jgi:hypothetical protein
VVAFQQRRAHEATCQQFLQFVGTKPGKRSVAFARKMVEKKHASSKEYLRHGRVFHLFSRNLYEAIGRENVRFRRVHSTEYIRTRLIALDFILRNQDFQYLESEDQKLSFFCDQLGIDKKILPHKRYSGAIKESYTDHYFVDKFPMHYNPAASLSPIGTPVASEGRVRNSCRKSSMSSRQISSKKVFLQLATNRLTAVR